jgi:hypothetical protein
MSWLGMTVYPRSQSEAYIQKYDPPLPSRPRSASPAPGIIVSAHCQLLARDVFSCISERFKLFNRGYLIILPAFKL